MKKETLVIIFHTFIWMGFSVVVWLSPRDKFQSKIILFIVFFYLAYIVAYMLLQRKRNALLSAVWNSAVFMFAKYIIFLFF